MRLEYQKEFDVIKKPELNRIVGKTVIPSYGKFEVHNEKFNKLLAFITQNTKKYQITNPTASQKALSDILNQQLDLYRLKILYDNYKRINDENDKKSAIAELLLYFSGFRNFCGPGTDIYKQIKYDNDNPTNMFKIDSTCVRHDIAFTHAKTFEDQKRADEIMMWEVFNTYLFDPKKSMFGKNPQSFATDQEQVKTIVGYMMSSVEAIVSGSIIYKGFQVIKDATVSGVNIIRNPSNIMRAAEFAGEATVGSLNMLKSAAKYVSQPFRYVRPQIKPPHRYLAESISNVGWNMYHTLQFLYQSINPNIYKLITTAGFTNIIKDKILAVGALAGIALKYAFEQLVISTASSEFKEYFQKYGIVIDIVQDEVSDEDLQNMKNMYEAIQNEILRESGLPPIKPITESDYESIKIESNPEILINDFKEVVMMQNENINTKFSRYENEKPTTYTEEQIKEANFVYNQTLSNPEEVGDKLIEAMQATQDKASQDTQDLQPTQDTQDKPIQAEPAPADKYIDELINEFFD